MKEGYPDDSSRRRRLSLWPQTRAVRIALVALLALSIAMAFMWRARHAVFWEPVAQNTLRRSLTKEVIDACARFKAREGRHSAQDASRIVVALGEPQPGVGPFLELARPKFTCTISQIVDLLGPPDVSRRRCVSFGADPHATEMHLALYRCTRGHADATEEKLLFFVDPSDGVVSYVSFGGFHGIE